MVFNGVVIGPEAARDLSVGHERAGGRCRVGGMEAEEKRRLLLLLGEVSMFHV